MIKDISLKVIIVSLTMLFVNVNAATLVSTKTDVKIVIDSQFKNKNIIFQILQDGMPETIGVYQAGNSLFINNWVNSVVQNQDCLPQTVQAFVSDTTNMTYRFQSTEQYCFMPGETVGLSFPIMFEQI